MVGAMQIESKKVSRRTFLKQATVAVGAASAFAILRAGPVWAVGTEFGVVVLLGPRVILTNQLLGPPAFSDRRHGLNMLCCSR